MSILLSDSLIGLVDERSLAGEDLDFIGKIDVNGQTYVIDAFVTDRKVIRVHALADPGIAIDLLSLRPDMTVKIVLGDDAFSASGKINQVGYERLPHGGRLVISMIVRDK